MHDDVDDSDDTNNDNAADLHVHAKLQIKRTFAAGGQVRLNH